jgi:hypothetical protein
MADAGAGDTMTSRARSVELMGSDPNDTVKSSKITVSAGIDQTTNSTRPS